MRINLITNTRSPGLWRDAEILRSLLASTGVSIHLIDNFDPAFDEGGRGAEISLFLESLHEGRYLHDYALSNWLIPNPEWYCPEWDRYLPLLSLILSKTRHAYRLFTDKVGPARSLYTGFTSRDMHAPGVAKNGNFLHVCGKSQSKGTAIVAEAWRRLPYPLTVVTWASNPVEEQVAKENILPFSGNGRVHHLHNLSDSRLQAEMLKAAYLIEPSLAEGHGHILHEAMSAQCVILTTDAEPMNAIPAILIPVMRTEPRYCVHWSYVSADGVAAAVDRAIRMTDQEREQLGERARLQWERERAEFERVFVDAVERWWSWI